MIVKCPKCGAKYRLDPKKFSGKSPKIKCKHCGEIFPVYENVVDWEGATPPSEGKKETPPPSGKANAIIATANSELAGVIEKILKSAGISPQIIRDGIEALYRITNQNPSIAIIDVDLPRLYGFEVSELVRRNDPQKNIKIILIGSIYNKDAYKRSPEYLYGADHYIDRHTIEEELPGIINQIAPSQEGKVSAPSETVPEEKPAPAEKKEIDLSSLSPEDQEWVKKAQRKARLIAADIALYNEDAIREGLIHGDVYERIAKDLKAGREHYEKTIPEHIRKLKDFLGEEIEKMLEAKRKEFGL